MIDIDYILGDGKKTRRKPSKGIAFSSYPVKKKTASNPLALFAGTPARKASDPFKKMFQGQSHPIVGDRVTPAQRKKFTKAKKLRDPFILFTDHDGDGVISGLDCAPKNPKKHMAYVRTMDRDEDVDEYLGRRFDGDEPKTIRLYHGTTDAHLDSIKKSGLQPPTKTNVKNFDVPKRYSDNVSLAENKSTAYWYARNNLEKGEPVIVGVDVPYSKYEEGLRKFRARQEGGDPYVGDSQGESDEILVSDVPPEAIKKVIPAQERIQEKEFRTDRWMHGSAAREREDQETMRNLQETFEDD